jgi:hypothetical protein
MSRVADHTIPSYIEAADPIDLGNYSAWTITAFFKVPDFSATGGDMTFIGRFDFADSEQYQWYLQCRSDGTIRFVYVDGFFEILDWALNDSGWHFVAIRRTGDQLKMRGDGVDITDTNTFTSAHATTAPMRLAIGGSSTTLQGPYSGKLSRVAFFSSYLSDAAVDALMTADPTGADFWTIGAADEVVDYGGFTTLTNHSTTYSSDEPFSAHTDYTLTADPTSYAATFASARLAVGRRVVAAGTTYAATPTNVTLRATRVLTAQSGSYSATGTNATLRRALRLAAASGSYASTFADAALRYSGAPSTYTLIADPGSYAMTGANATPRRTYAILAGSTSYAVTGSNATLRTARVLLAGSGTYAYTPASAQLSRGLRVNALPASYSVVGSDATLRKASRLSAGATSYAYTPSNAALRAARRLVADPTTYALTGSPATLTYSGAGSTYTLVADPGVYAMVAANATLRAQRVIFAGNAVYGITGGNATLRASRILHGDFATYGMSATNARVAVGRRLNANPATYSCNPSLTDLRASRRLIAGFTTYLSVFLNATLHASFEGDLIPRTRGIARYDTITRLSALYSRVTASQGQYQPRTAMTVNVEN